MDIPAPSIPIQCATAQIAAENARVIYETELLTLETAKLRYMKMVCYCATTFMVAVGAMTYLIVKVLH